MSDLAGLPPLLRLAMRTGQLPSDAELAAATGRTVDEVARLLRTGPGDPKSATADGTPTADPEFRNQLQLLIAGLIDDWWQQNPTAWHLPDDQRERIEDHCREQIEYEWRQRRALYADDTATDPEVPFHG